MRGGRGRFTEGSSAPGSIAFQGTHSGWQGAKCAPGSGPQALCLPACERSQHGMLGPPPRPPLQRVERMQIETLWWVLSQERLGDQVDASRPLLLTQLKQINLPPGIPAPTLPRPPRSPPLGPYGQRTSKGEEQASRHPAHGEAQLEKVTCRPVTAFFPSERLSHCRRPGPAGRGGWEHAWTVSALSEAGP